MKHGQSGQFYDYDRVVVTWRDGTEATYKIGEDRSGYADDSALSQANMILSLHAQGYGIALRNA